ncbi:hypothetical protein [Falsirhodobacter deserti]|uniref:hypothetical protein n=1 Tax=Falsirhodobacter deserti TaxID=1365611 RepID=UPI000FE3F6D0|nr:hypothetical protein [Falsirhodobacter deserti]
MICKEGNRPHVPFLCVMAFLGTSALPALAQDDRARSLTLDLSQGLEVASNPELIDDPARDQVMLRSDVDLRYVTATRVQRMEMGIGGQFEAGDFAGRDSASRVAERRLDFGYSRESASAELQVIAAYSRARVEDTTLPESVESDDLEVTTGERGLTRFELDLETGRDRRIGTEVHASASSVRYFDNDGDGRDNADLTAALRLSVGARTDVMLLSGLSRKDYKNDEEYEFDSSWIGFGMRHALTARQRVHGQLLSMRVDSSEISDVTGSLEEDRQEGLGGAVGYEVDLGRGTIGIGFETALHSTGRRDLLEVSHETASEAGGLRVSLGVVDSDELDQRPLLNIVWQRNISSARLQLSLEQDAISTEDEETIRSRLGVGYLGQINSTSSWEAQVSVIDLNEFGLEATDNRRSEMMVGYRHALTRDWDLSVRYRHVLSESDGRDDRRNDSLYLGLATRVHLW